MSRTRILTWDDKALTAVSFPTKTCKLFCLPFIRIFSRKKVFIKLVYLYIPLKICIFCIGSTRGTPTWQLPIPFWWLTPSKTRTSTKSDYEKVRHSGLLAKRKATKGAESNPGSLGKARELQCPWRTTKCPQRITKCPLTQYWYNLSDTSIDAVTSKSVYFQMLKVRFNR